MKKYLIKGALALFAGTLVVSCAEKESEYVPVAQQKVKAFEEVFKEVYGDNIDPYQDWGFNGGKTNLDPKDESIYVDVVDADGDPVLTRAIAFGRNAVMAFPNRTRAAYPNANMWASQGYTVPPELTAGQKLRVQYYFQTVKITNPTRPQYGDISFFIQQVYDGGDDPMTSHNTGNNPSTGEPYSKEVYPAANNQTNITSGEHMDHLTAGPNHTHINNFNNGTYGTKGEPNHEVSNSTGVTYHSKGSKEEFHSDQIQLMLNTNTNCFGYANSDDSFVRDDRWTLVDWKIIEDYCNNSANGYETWRSTYHSDIPDDSLNDKWDRSFLAFDFDMLPDDKLYVKDGNNNYSYFSVGLWGRDEVWDGTKFVSASSVGEIIDGRLYPWIPGTRTKIRMMTDQTNQYCGSTTTITDAELEYEVNNVGKFTNLGKIYELLDQYALPTSSGAGKTWVKVGNCADGYYSDWIVSFLKASQSFDQYLETEEEKWVVAKEGRVFCEDLGRATREDLDYNDVVFDVKIWERTYHYEKKLAKYSDQAKTHLLAGYPITVGNPVDQGPDYYAQITLRAAGGTIPITIKAGGTEYQVHDQFNSPEPTAIATMVNTRDNNSVAYGSFATRDPVDLVGQDVVKRTFKMTNNVVQEAEQKFTINAIPGISEINQIQIRSSFDGKDVQELSSKIGETPQKFMVPITTKWTSERKNISLGYPGFNAWVSDRTKTPWAGGNDDYLYSVENPYKEGENYLHVPNAVRVKRNHSLEGEIILFEGTKKFGYDTNWTLEVLKDLSIAAVGQFSAGDVIRFYASGMPVPSAGQEFTNDDQKSWITVVIGSIKPYFIDQEFPNYEFEGGKKVFKDSGCLEVVLDEYAANLLNGQINNNTVSLEVQGRNFTLTKVCVVKK